LWHQTFYIYIIFLVGAAGIEHANLGRPNATAGLIGTDAIRKVVVGGVENAGAMGTHPLAAGAGRNLEAGTRIGLLGNTGTICTTGNKGGDGKQKA
jgi:hypothetical protein